MDFGQAIKRLRKAQNTSQRDLATACDISQTSLSLIENSVKNPSNKTIKAVAAALKVPLALIYIMAIEEADWGGSQQLICQIPFSVMQSSVYDLATGNKNPDVEYRVYQNPAMYSIVQ